MCSSLLSCSNTCISLLPTRSRLDPYRLQSMKCLRFPFPSTRQLWHNLDPHTRIAAMKTRAKQEGDKGGQTRLVDKKVRDLMMQRRRLVEVPYTATLAHTMNALVANNVVAVPVAAPPGHWIGAGGSMIVESDKETGTVRKHYIGMVTMLDIVAHIAADDHHDEMIDDLDEKLSAQVSTIIGHCLEGLSLWTLNPKTSIIDCMEVFSKGIHRALVPVDSHMENISGAELVESASSYQMVTQMDLMKFLRNHSTDLGNIILRSVGELGAISESAYAITDRARVIDAIKCMRISLLNAVPIVHASNLKEEDHKQLVNGRHRKVIGTFSATDLRGCHLSALRTWLPLNALEFTEKIQTVSIFAASSVETRAREVVTCYKESSVVEVIEKVATKHVHRVWVVDGEGLLEGVLSLSDIIGVIRTELMSGRGYI